MDAFTESLVANVSPNASPFLSSCISPVKQGDKRVRKSSTAVDDFPDESSVDIYGDIEEVSAVLLQPAIRTQDGKLSSSKLQEGSSSQEIKEKSISSFDIFHGVPTSDQSVIEKLESQVKELQESNKKLQSQNEVLSTNKVHLTKNISCLFVTSRKELQKRELELEELRNVVKNLQARVEEIEQSSNISSASSEKVGPSSKSREQNSHKSSRKSPIKEGRSHRSSPSSRTQRKHSPAAEKVQDRLLRLANDESPSQGCQKDLDHRKTGRKEKVEDKHNSANRASNKRSGSSDRTDSRNRNTEKRDSKETRLNTEVARNSSLHTDAMNSRKQSCSQVDESTSCKKKPKPSPIKAPGDSRPPTRPQSPQICPQPGASNSSTKNTLVKYHSSKSSLSSKRSKEVPLCDSIVASSDSSSINVSSSRPSESVLLAHKRKRKSLHQRVVSVSPKKSKESHCPLTESFSSDLSGSHVNSKLVNQKTLERNMLSEASSGFQRQAEKPVAKQSFEDNSSCISSQKTETARLVEKSDSCREVYNEQPSIKGIENECEKKKKVRSNVEVNDFHSESHGGGQMNCPKVPLKQSTNLTDVNMAMGRFTTSCSLENTVSTSSGCDLIEKQGSKMCRENAESQHNTEVQVKQKDTQLLQSIKEKKIQNTYGELSNRSRKTNKENTLREQSVLNVVTYDVKMTNCIVSNQDYASLSPNSSLPFSQISGTDIDSFKRNESQSSNTISHVLSSNQTWPFENRDSTTASKDTLMSVLEKSDGNRIKECGDDKALTFSTSRAFPIAELDCGVGTTTKSNVVQGKDLVLDFKISSQESGNSDFCRGLSKDSSSSSNTLESTSEESQNAVKNALFPMNSDFKSPMKQGHLWNSGLDDYEDCTNLTPPKSKLIGGKSQCFMTPPKHLGFDVENDSCSPTESFKIMCTPNLIVLGDEEATCATTISPFKPQQVPSEFIPPGVRMEMKEINTHHRHIRGEPELLHDPRVPGQELSPVYDKESPDSPPTEERHFNCTQKTKKKLETGRNVDQAVSNVIEEKERIPLQPVMSKAFQEVFNQDFFTFKEEMSASCEKNNQLLRSHLTKSAAKIKKSMSPKKSTASYGIEPSVSNEVNSDPINKILRKNISRDCESTSSENIASKNDTVEQVSKAQCNLLNEAVWHKSLNIKPMKQNISTDFTCAQVSSHFPKSPFANKTEISDKLTRQLPVESESKGHRDLNGIMQSIQTKITPVKDQHSRKNCLSPNSCAVTSSDLHSIDQELECDERARSDESEASTIPNCPREVRHPLEPDSTSDPIVLKHSEKLCLAKAPNDGSGKMHIPQRAGKDTKGSQSPDSPSKGLIYLKNYHSNSPKSSKKHRSDSKLVGVGSKSPCSGNGMDLVPFSAVKDVTCDLHLSSSSEDSDSEAGGDETLTASSPHTSKDFKVEDRFHAAQGDTDPSRCSVSSLLRAESNNDQQQQPGYVSGWEGMSLMEANSLSEFDRDVMLDQQREIRAARGSSRTASLSSHISVGGFSPLSVSSTKMSTPSHIRSPKDSLWSPMNRISDSQDPCQEDVRTPPCQDLSEWNCMGGHSGEPSTSVSKEIPSTQQQLTRFMPLHELQELKLVKTKFVMHHSSGEESDSSSSGEDDDDSGGSTNSSDDDDDGSDNTDCQTPVKSVRDTVCRRSSVKKRTSPPATPPSHGSRMHTQHSSPVRSAATNLYRENVGSPRQSPRIKALMMGSVNRLATTGENVRRSPNSKTQHLKPNSPNQHKNKRTGTKKGSNHTLVLDDKYKSDDKNNCHLGIESTSTNIDTIHVEKQIVVPRNPRKSVKIKEDNLASEDIVIGSVASGNKNEENFLLRRLHLSSPETSQCSSQSPAKKGRDLSTVGAANDTVIKINKPDINSSERKNTHKEQATETLSESAYKVSPVERRPLSLQEESRVDLLLELSRKEFVHNVKKVTRILDLDKKKLPSGELSNPLQGSDDDERLSDHSEISGSKEGVPEPPASTEFVDEVEEGEILDDDEEEDNDSQSECKEEEMQRGTNIPTDKSKGLPKNTNKLSENNAVHITQEGCKTIPSIKSSMSAKRGKNFVTRKHSNHGISPMARLYSPQLSASSCDESKERRKTKVWVGKRLRSISPVLSERRKPLKSQKIDSHRGSSSSERAPIKLSPKKSSTSSDRRRTDRSRQTSPRSSSSSRSNMRCDRSLSRSQQSSLSPVSRTARYTSPRRRTREEQKSRSPEKRCKQVSKRVSNEDKRSTHRCPKQRDRSRHSPCYSDRW